MTLVYRILHQEDTECSLHSAGVLVWSRWPRSLYPRPHSPGHIPASVLRVVPCGLGSGLSPGRHWAVRNLLPVPGHRPDQPHQGHGHQELRDRVLLHPPGEPTSVKARSIFYSKLSGDHIWDGAALSGLLGCPHDCVRCFLHGI